VLAKEALYHVSHTSSPQGNFVILAKFYLCAVPICSLKLVLLYHTWAWWYRPVIPVLGRLSGLHTKFKGSLSYITRPCLKKQN
jgi:hypothetical protein